MKIWIITLIALLLTTLLLAIGVLIGGRNKILKGSCGGLNKALGQKDSPCDFCGRKDLCENEEEFTQRVVEKKQLDPLI